MTFSEIPKKSQFVTFSGFCYQGGVIVTFSGFIFQFFCKLCQINSKCHLSTLNYIFCFGTGLQVNSNPGEGCAGFSEKVPCAAARVDRSQLV